ncbi:hypothetical protein [Streptosporangium sp. OZ121]|uniref:hypothetical protein n=1 Tax=Streptosporangium sp. OZ121 TaxID=3444183 RepID=UPI003F7A63C7
MQTALAEAWLAWRRVGDDPDPYVYRILVNTHATWWRRRWRGEVPSEVLPEAPDGHTSAAPGRGARRHPASAVPEATGALAARGHPFRPGSHPRQVPQAVASAGCRCVARS